MDFLDILRWPKFELGHRRLRPPKARGPVPYDEASADAVERTLDAAGIRVASLRVSIEEYRQYLQRADYSRHRDYYAWKHPRYAEKTLEHFLAAQLLELRPGGVHIDVAGDTSPVPEIYADVYGVTAYRQDLRFPAGVIGSRIGGDAGAMPVPDGFADTMSLHCSFEHFEGDSDIRFIGECGRVLRPGGRVCIVPLYLSTGYAVMTDPGVLSRGHWPAFEPDATVHSVAWYGQRHGRFYDVEHLRSRILSRMGVLKPTVYRVANLEEISASCYARFVLLLHKQA